jgi:hypothetical protein
MERDAGSERTSPTALFRNHYSKNTPSRIPNLPFLWKTNIAPDTQMLLRTTPKISSVSCIVRRG